jgi:hypothetical protein
VCVCLYKPFVLGNVQIYTMIIPDPESILFLVDYFLSYILILLHAIRCYDRVIVFMRMMRMMNV